MDALGDENPEETFSGMVEIIWNAEIVFMPIGNHKLSHYMPAKVQMKTRMLLRSVILNQVWLLSCPSLVLEWCCTCATGSPEKVLEDAYGPADDSEAKWGLCYTCVFLCLILSRKKKQRLNNQHFPCKIRSLAKSHKFLQDLFMIE